MYCFTSRVQPPSSAPFVLTPRPPGQVHAIHAGMIANPGALGAHAGWKVGTTNPTAWSGFGLVEPMRAPLFANSIVKAPATYSRKDDNLTMLEAEFAFTLKSELSASWDSPITADDAWAAVDEVFLAIEVCGSRFLPEAFAEASPYQKIADAGMNVALLLGPSFSAEEMRSKDLAGCKAQLIANGEVGGEGTGADVLGRAPLLPLPHYPPSLPHQSHALGRPDQQHLLPGQRAGAHGRQPAGGHHHHHRRRRGHAANGLQGRRHGRGQVRGHRGADHEHRHRQQSV